MVHYLMIVLCLLLMQFPEDSGNSRKSGNSWRNLEVWKRLPVIPELHKNYTKNFLPGLP